MYTIRSAFLNRFSDFCNPGIYFINAMSVKLSQNSNSPEDTIFSFRQYGEVPKLQIKYPTLSNYDTATDTDKIRKSVNPDKNFKSVVAFERDFPTGKDFVHALEMMEEVEHELEELQTIYSEDHYTGEEETGSSTQSDIVLQM